MSSTTEPKKLHIALFPWLAFGHIIPFLEVAKHIARRGHKGISEFLRTQIPDWIIYDFASYWLPPIAIELGISRAFFNISNAATQCFFGPTSPDLISRYGHRTQPEDLTGLPVWIPFPSKIAYRLFEAKRLFNIAANKPNTSAAEAIEALQNRIVYVQSAVEG
ncbi:PREDICTED: putative UDP-rhamnose:rhamnosyltransferase 1-like [Fragaria vesca subsp. vesca]